MHIADAVVIGIEEITEFAMIRLISIRMRRQNKCFEEPRRMGEVPFDRARLLHGLQHTVLRTERLRELFADAPDARNSFEYSPGVWFSGQIEGHGA